MTQEESRCGYRGSLHADPPPPRLPPVSVSQRRPHDCAAFRRTIPPTLRAMPPLGVLHGAAKCWRCRPKPLPPLQFHDGIGDQLVTRPCVPAAQQEQRRQPPLSELIHDKQIAP